ncbi:MAG: hypothetical protein ACRD29_14595 [Acidimicrobiales bacterium]
MTHQVAEAVRFDHPIDDGLVHLERGIAFTATFQDAFANVTGADLATQQQREALAAELMNGTIRAVVGATGGGGGSLISPLIGPGGELFTADHAEQVAALMGDLEAGRAGDRANLLDQIFFLRYEAALDFVENNPEHPNAAQAQQFVDEVQAEYRERGAFDLDGHLRLPSDVAPVYRDVRVGETDITGLDELTRLIDTYNTR